MITIPQNEVEIAWAAGFFDGEGNIRWNAVKSVRKQRIYGTVAVQVAQVDRAVLDRFRDAVGLGTVRGPYRARSENRKPYFQYSVFGGSAVLVFEKLRPYLSPVKIGQAVEPYKKLDEQRSRPPLKRGPKTNVKRDVNTSTETVSI